MDDPVFCSDASSTYAYIFQEKINELLTCRTGFQEMLSIYLRQTFLLVRRTRMEEKPSVSTYIQEEIEYARRYFNEHYNEPISIQDYAESRNMSVCWFQRNFKQIVSHTPMQYLLTIRVNNAASLSPPSWATRTRCTSAACSAISRACCCLDTGNWFEKIKR